MSGNDTDGKLKATWLNLFKLWFWIAVFWLAELGHGFIQSLGDFTVPQWRPIKTRVFEGLRPKAQDLWNATWTIFFLTAVSLLLGIILYTLALIIFPVQDPLTNPIHLQVAPTPIVVAPTPTYQAQLDWAEQVVAENGGWLSPLESQELRSQQNVINLLVVGYSGTKIARNVSLTLDESWQQRRPPVIESLQLEGTSVLIEADGIQLSINVHMPFLVEGWHNQVMIVDEFGVIWTTAAQDLVPMSLEAARANLPITIAANPRLNLAFSPQQ